MLFGVIVLYTLVGFVGYEWLRRSPKTSWFFFGIMPLLLTPIWLTLKETHDWFIWMKVYTCLAATCCILSIRFTRLSRQKWPYYLIHFLVNLNILEAVVRAWAIPDSIPAILNGFAGLFLMFTLRLPSYMSVDSGKYRDFLWDLPYPWVLGYVFWNWDVIYLIFPFAAAIQCAVLLVPLIVALINNKLFVQARAFTLSFYLVAGLTFPYFANTPVSPGWENIHAAWIVSILVFIWMFIYFLYIYIPKFKHFFKK